MSKVRKNILAETRDRFLFKVSEATEAIDKKIIDLQNAQAALTSQEQLFHKQISEQLKKSSSTIFQVSPHEIIAKTFSGTKISLDPQDVSVTPHLALDGVWEQDITNAWLNTVTPTDTVLDIGANFGYYGLLAAQQNHASKAKVYFFEANPKLIPYINKTLAINNYYENSKVENLAISDKKGTATLNVLKDYIGSSSLHTVDQLDVYAGGRMHLELSESIKVKAVTIDDYCEDQDISSVDLIKMDIEGYEDRAYKGMRKTIQKSPSVTMFIEFTKGGYAKPKEFYNEMMEDFKAVYLIASDGSLVKPAKSDYESLLGGLDDWAMLVLTKNKSIIKKIES